MSPIIPYSHLRVPMLPYYETHTETRRAC